MPPATFKVEVGADTVYEGPELKTEERISFTLLVSAGEKWRAAESFGTIKGVEAVAELG